MWQIQLMFRSSSRACPLPCSCSSAGPRKSLNKGFDLRNVRISMFSMFQKVRKLLHIFMTRLGHWLRNIFITFFVSICYCFVFFELQHPGFFKGLLLRTSSSKVFKPRNSTNPPAVQDYTDFRYQNLELITRCLLRIVSVVSVVGKVLR